MHIIALPFLLLLSSCVWASSHIVNVPEDYDSIQEAIDAAAEDLNFSTVLIQPGTYELSSPVFLRRGITVQGADTHATIITESADFDGVALFILDDTESGTMKIQNLTFGDGPLGILLTNGTTSGLQITNNIFYVDSRNAIEIGDASTPKITHNVFYRNNYAIYGNDTSSPLYTYEIKNNIFLLNKYIKTSNVGSDSFRYNCYFNNTFSLDDSDIDTNSVVDDPDFALLDDENNEHDFRLRDTSPCIDKGDPSVGISDPLKDELPASLPDMGAFGGVNAQKEPAPVAFEVVANEDKTEIKFIWRPTLAHEVKDIGGYKLYFGETSNEYDDYVSGALSSPIELTDAVTEDDGRWSKVISGFSAPSGNIDSPTINSVSAFNERLLVNWSDVSDASGYEISYTGSDGSSETIDVEEDVTEYAIEGLTNGVSYTVTVSAYLQPSLYFYLRAYEGLSDPVDTPYESVWAEAYEQSVAVGEKVSSDPSASMTAIPDAITPYPQLSGEGCFIATATYGSYDATQVQTFRNFRDKFLLPTYLGSKFVKLYYTHGPKGARWLNKHAEFKKPMQWLLYPYLLLSWLFLELGLGAGLFATGLLLLFGVTVFIYSFVGIRRVVDYVV